MHLQLSILVVFCVIIVSGQREYCEGLERKCELCLGTLNNNDDRQMAFLNKECKSKTQRTWVWRDVHRCEFFKLNCLGRDRRMNCSDVAALAGMRRTRT